MADPHPAPIKSSESDKVHEAIIACLGKGMSPPQIAKHMYPEDKKARRTMRLRIWRMVREDAQFHVKVAQQAKAQMVTDLLPATQALGRRAKKGRPDAIKLLFEASGFHNPKVKHEHSGDIKVTLDMPRPKRVETLDANDDEVVDAEVVEE
jgi:hypothetical protein